MKTAFFGGSFNPPHSGHLGVARGALASGRTDRILWVVGFSPPHKPGRPMAPFEERLKMVELLIADEPAMASCDIEARLRLSPSYTIDILDAFSRENNDELQLLIGGDSLRDLHSWHRAPELAERYEILTYPRRGETPDAKELSQHWRPEIVEKLLAGVIPGEFFEISSTNIRNLVANHAGRGHIMPREVPAALSEYIRTHHFYQTGAHTMSETMKKPTPAELADFCLKCTEDKLAQNPIKIQVSPQSSVADWYVIATANSEPQLRALISHLERQTREIYHLRPLSENGESASGWMLIDFGAVIVHIMTPEVRDRYNLEGLWGETPAPDAVKNLAEYQP